MTETKPPNFLFVCDHGIRDGELFIVALLPWIPDRPGWWAAKGVHEAALKVWPMEGDQRGHDSKWLMPDWTDPDEPDLRGEAIEIQCTKCTQRAYRSDGGRLHTLLTKIVTDEQFRAVTVSADEKLIVMRLQALHSAREYVKRHCGLQV